MGDGSPAQDSTVGVRSGGVLPETPHELPYDRSKIDALLSRIQDGAAIDLLDELLGAVDWSVFGGQGGRPLSPLDRAELELYYRTKFAEVGPLYLAELLSTEFMTEQRARGDIRFSERLLTLGRTEPELWAEIRRFFRRKEMATAMLAAAHRPVRRWRFGRAERDRWRERGMSRSRICVVGGGGYVGLGYAVCLAELGHDVVGLDIDAERVERLNSGESPLFEAGLTPLLHRGLTAGRLRFTTDYAEALCGAEFVLLCTGTPSLSDGEADLRQVRSAATAIGAHLQPDKPAIVINKSTMPVGSAELVATLVAAHAPSGTEVRVVSNPEFLREGRVVHDILRPDRIVLGRR
jgi:hypothetical protein